MNGPYMERGLSSNNNRCTPMPTPRPFRGLPRGRRSRGEVCGGAVRRWDRPTHGPAPLHQPHARAERTPAGTHRTVRQYGSLALPAPDEAADGACSPLRRLAIAWLEIRAFLRTCQQRQRLTRSATACQPLPAPMCTNRSLGSLLPSPPATHAGPRVGAIQRLLRVRLPRPRGDGHLRQPEAALPAVLQAGEAGAVVYSKHVCVLLT